MFDFLDIRTLFFIGAVNAYVCALMMIGSRRLHPPSRAALLWGGATTLAVGSAMLLITMRGRMPDMITVLLANTMGSVGALGIYQSFRLLCGRPPRTLLIGTVAAAVVAIHLLLGSGLDNHPMRILVTCVMQASCACLVVPMLLRRRGLDAPLPLQWSVGVMATFAALNILRFFAVVRHGLNVDGGGMLAGSAMQTLAITIYALAPMAFALTFIGVVNARLAGDLRRLALTDSLTGLLTRRGFHEKATGMLARTGGQTGTIALLMIDIDHFKSINDRYGHNAGDRVLREFAYRLQHLAPDDAVVGRHGGEEFCVMLDCGDADSARRIAEALGARIRSEPVHDGARRIRLSVSIGVATDAVDGRRLEDLIATADRRAYFAKDSGRDCVIADDDVSTLVRLASAQRELVPV